MRIFKLAVAPVFVLALAGCLDTDAERALAGAAAGALIADATGNNVAAGAAVGAAGGALCDDAGVCN
ncbi:hypothetical protein ACMU_06030 [Actibacterium mucosum KCTC 23349]|uniref:YMGG-like Gly-zipper domain-containing protein n=1 Tax=Actibacterium mucosum KCTC 23349 TaxID=1454373 RepID=A0A037ZK72_9RHOB|nr:hypothetical protein [Actibacterium mucosum]KAJ56498.1 hypothetical protein ACMU_06030 [Actibacterium mucosum KCTC 23349]